MIVSVSVSMSVSVLVFVTDREAVMQIHIPTVTVTVILTVILTALAVVITVVFRVLFSAISHVVIPVVSPAVTRIVLRCPFADRNSESELCVLYSVSCLLRLIHGFSPTTTDLSATHRRRFGVRF